MNDSKKQIKTRFAPSPTGPFHVGGVRTALFNFLFTRNVGGEFLLRVEDTDTERSLKKYEDEMKEALEWLNIEYDSAPVRQSERTKLYSDYLQKLIDSGHAYISKEEEGERDEVIRFKNSGKVVKFQDEIRGEIEFDTTELGDFVIAKSIEEPLYHLAVVIDDHEMGITHVIRGEDHISNTPRQILIQEAIGAERPIYAHIPLILGADKSKLSKRHGATAVLQYREEGYLPEAFNNYLALLGWNPGDDREIFTLEELISEFSLSGVQKGGAIFNQEKLLWVNRQHILNLSDHDFFHHVEENIPADLKKLPNYNTKMLKKILPLIRERTEKITDITKMGDEGELEYYFEQPGYFAKGLLWRDDEDLEISKKHLKHAQETFEEIDEESWNRDMTKGMIWEYATEQGRGSVLWPLRYALSGMDRSPDPFELAEVLGKEETLSRIDVAIDRIEEEGSGI
ncbi:MAG: glutamate--tRNA ligase [Candidatus Paceibacterota bacterium]